MTGNDRKGKGDESGGVNVNTGGENGRQVLSKQPRQEGRILKEPYDAAHVITYINFPLIRSIEFKN
jgi:hypothetical protein